MKKRGALAWLVTWVLLIMVAFSNFIVATLLIKADQNPFSKIGSQAFDELVDKIKNGQSNLTPDKMAKLLIGEHKNAKAKDNFINSLRQVLLSNGYAISFCVLLQLYIILRLRRLNFLPSETAKVTIHA